MDGSERLLELVGATQRDLVPTLVRMHEQDDLRILHSVMLRALDQRGEPTLKQLAALIDRSESRTSRLVDQLVRRGLVERAEDCADRRVRRLRISAEGTALLRRLESVHVEAQLELWKHLTEDEQRIVLRAMELLAKAAKRSRAEHDRAEDERPEREQPG